ncbi:MAG: pantoate--beta-alanine ligase [Hyphomicrobiaceae bacterium]
MPTTPIPVSATVADLRLRVRTWRSEGRRIGLVPTMGALHEGHISLVRIARETCDRVVTSIFVNPTQFAPHEDFSTYPRTFDDDLAKLAAAECHLVWAPTAQEMYPEGFATRVAPAGAADGLETDFRPHFFGGVATVCTKLFQQVTPDIAVFGEKDFQQLAVIRQIVRDLNMPLAIVGAPTVREADGLAMSSRNRYLSPDERRTAPLIHQVILEVAAAVRAGEPAGALCIDAANKLTAAGFAKVDYVAVRDAATLGPYDPTRGAGRVLAAAWLGTTRLIDNIAIEP